MSEDTRPFPFLDHTLVERQAIAEVLRQEHNARSVAKSVYEAKTGEAQAEYEAAIIRIETDRFTGLMNVEIDRIVRASQSKGESS